MNVIIDTDVDFDDYMAMVYILLHKDINVLGITVTGCGAAHLSEGIANVRQMLTLFDSEIQKTPVMAGSSSPMRYSNVFPFDVRKAADEHYDVTFPGINPNPASTDEASEWIAETLKTSQGPIDFLLIGGGTNFVRAIQKLGKGGLGSVGRVVMMGGNLLSKYITPGADGNILDTLGKTPYYTNAVAEWNIFIDVEAAELVLSSGLDITLVALNACQDVPITQDLVNNIQAIQTPYAQFIYDILTSSANKDGIGTFLKFWDPLAASVLVYPDLVTTESFKIRVEQELNEEQDTSGEIIVDDVNGLAVNVAVSADTSAVYAQYLDALRGGFLEVSHV
jgi:pyrimidine-specific ribonucleoside hydrolase